MEPEEIKSGFSYRSVMAVLYSVCVFTPAVIWLDLVTLGVSLVGAIPFCTLFLFAEFARISGKPLTKQEATVIFGPASVIGSAGFLALIYHSWFVKQPMIKSIFNINPLNIPVWFAPPVTSQAFELRTFSHPDMTLPIVISITYYLLGLAGAIFFASFLREIYIEGERLPFPIQTITVGAITTLTERDQKRVDVFSWCAFIAFIYAAVLYLIPVVSSTAGYPITTLPVPWIDVTGMVQLFIPGIAIGVATDIMVLSQGFVLPPNIVSGMLIGSAVRFLIVNPMLVNFGWTNWAKMYVQGMSITQIFQYSTLYFWLNPLIGAGFAIGIIPIVWKARIFVGSFKNFISGRFTAETKERISGPTFSTLTLAILFFIGCVCPFMLDVVLAPGFPIWIFAVYEIGLPFIICLAAGRMIGLTGQGLGGGEAQLPYLNQLTILGGYAFGYNKIDAWFVPLTLNPGTAWMANMKVCQLTGTSITSWIKATLIAYPIGIIAGLVYMQLFWQLSSIPSAMYPSPAITWPISLIQQCAWITRPEGYFDVYQIVFSFLFFAVLISVLQPTRLSFSMVSVLAGLSMPIPIALTMFIGLIVGKGIIARAMGKKQFDNYRITMAAGIALGEAIAIVIGVTAALIMKSIFGMPY